MKNSHVLFYLLSTVIMLHGAQQQQSEPSWKAINCNEVKKVLRQNCKSYFKNRLEEYKKSDFTDSVMNHIAYIGFMITGKCGNVRLNDILDDNKDTFTHIAIKKLDLSILKWLDCKEGRYFPYGVNKDGKEPLDLCIDYLLPNAIKDKDATTQVAHDMLDVLTAAYDTYSFNLDYRKKFLRKIVALQLEHKKHNTGFVLKDVLFTRFLKQEAKAQPTIVLADIYREVMNQDKNTFTHIVVQQSLPDELYDLIKKEYVTFTKNDEGKTPVDLACEWFCQSTGCREIVITPTFTNRRCCLFMLLNYVQTLQNSLNKNVVMCCEKHVL